MTTVEKLRNTAPENMTSDLGYLVAALVRTASAALEADPGCDGWAVRNGDVRQVLNLAAGLCDPLIDGAESLERIAQRGLHRAKA